MRLMPIAAAGAALLTCHAWPAAAQPSFDCAQAATKVEHAICGDQDLSALDAQVAEDYRQRGRITPMDARRIVTRNQSEWIARRESQCGQDTASQAAASDCLKKMMTARAASLEAELIAVAKGHAEPAVSKTAAPCPTPGQDNDCPFMLDLTPVGTAYDLIGGTIVPVRRWYYSAPVKAGQTIFIHFLGPGAFKGEIQCPKDGDGPFDRTGSVTSSVAGRCIVDVGASPMAEPVAGPFYLLIEYN